MDEGVSEFWMDGLVQHTNFVTVVNAVVGYKKQYGGKIAHALPRMKLT